MTDGGGWCQGESAIAHQYSLLRLTSLLLAGRGMILRSFPMPVSMRADGQ